MASGVALSPSEARELASIMNRARRVGLLLGGLQLVCRTPQECSRAAALLARQGRSPERNSPYKRTCAPRPQREDRGVADGGRV